MEDVLRAVALGIVQGLTEFLPISSSGHLIVVRDLFGWESTDELTFDVGLHLGTTAAVIAFFWSEWRQMLQSGWGLVTRATRAQGAYDERLLLLLVVGSIPAGVAGVIFDAYLEDEVRDPIVVGAMLVVFGAVLLIAELRGKGEREIESTGWRDAVWIGTAQALALIPGVSRSGVTISAGLFSGFTRQAAARFSFLLSTAPIAGAGALKLTDAAKDGVLADEIDVILIGAVVSGIVGWLSIRYLLRLLQTQRYVPFVLYRFAAGAFVLLYFAA